MSHRLRHLLATSGLVLCTATPTAAQIVAYHDVSSAGHQANFDNLYAQGYRLESLSVYGVAIPVYAAVWSKKSGPAWNGFHDKSPSEYQALFNTYTAQGYRPKILAATGSGSNAVFAGTFEKDGLGYTARHGIDQQTFWTLCDQARKSGKILSWAAVYGSAAVPEYAGIWTDNVDNTSWQASIDSSASGFQKRFNAYGQVAVRPHFVTLSVSQRYLAVWHDDLIGNWICHPTMTSASYTANTQSYSQSGYYPLVAQAAGPSAFATFAAVFVKSVSITPRVPNITGTAVPGFLGFDAYVLQTMGANNIRAGALAIVKDGALAYARGYTLAEPGYPITQPTGMFRIASCAKPLTSIAVHQAYEQNKLAAWQTVPLVFNLSPPAIFAPELLSTTVDHLLGHLGGWDVSMAGLNYDPMFYDIQISVAASTPLPIQKPDIFRFMTTTQPMQFPPGSQYAYSNYGFSLLGQALERVNSSLSPLTYEQVVHRDVFAPLGVTRPHIGASLQGNQAAGEVRYHPRAPGVGASRFDPANGSTNPTGAWVPEQYGAWNQGNLDAHGGWVMAAPDFAKVLAAFDLPNNPLLMSTSTTNMWTNPALPTSIKPDLLRGWFSVTLPDQSGTNQAAAWHNGGLPGTAGLVLRRADGLSFVLFFNGDAGLFGSPHGLALSNLANAVPAWPTKDLFPSVGIPAFPRRMTLTTALVSRLPNVTRDSFVLQGTNLGFVTEVQLGGSRITSTSPSGWANGYFQVVGSTRLLVFPPQGLAPGAYSVSASDGTTSSNALPVTITPTNTPTVEGPAQVPVGTGFALFATHGASQPVGSLLLLAASSQQTPSTLPNIVTLGIGSQFQSLVLWPSAVGVDPATGVATFALPSLASLAGTNLYFQAAVIDPTGALPLPTTNVTQVSL